MRSGGPGATEPNQIEDQQQHPAGDCRIRDVEDVERVSLPVKVKEICNGAIEQPVEGVRQGPADAQRQQSSEASVDPPALTTTLKPEGPPLGARAWPARPSE